MDRNQILGLADEIFKAERSVLEMKQELLMELVSSGLQEYFTVNWSKLRRETGRHPQHRNV